MYIHKNYVQSIGKWIIYYIYLMIQRTILLLSILHNKAFYSHLAVHRAACSTEAKEITRYLLETQALTEDTYSAG